jgi:hypothetical protein
MLQMTKQIKELGLQRGRPEHTLLTQFWSSQVKDSNLVSKKKTTTSLLDDVSIFLCYFSDRWSMPKKRQNPGSLISH